MLTKSSAQSDASSPPAAGLISMMATFASSMGSVGNIATWNLSSKAARCSFRSDNSKLANSASSSSPLASSFASSIWPTVFKRSSYRLTSSDTLESTLAFFATSFCDKEPASSSSFSSLSFCCLDSYTLFTKRMSISSLAASSICSASSSLTLAALARRATVEQTLLCSLACHDSPWQALGNDSGFTKSRRDASVSAAAAPKHHISRSLTCCCRTLLLPLFLRNSTG
mmetsp:Transcript_30736/g.60421  ORF Transcript_30736/g.60421 Transcript_30736/m.60421 type:complete len:227 (+) Transcript_30736:680-1360(+)